MATLANSRQLCITLLLCSVLSTGTCADSIYQWTDRYGQIHFADSPPDSAATTATLLPGTQPPAATGLRPGEVAVLQAFEQRTERQQQRARRARQRSTQQQTAARATCRTHREQLRSSTGKDAFKKHARYLRTHCW